MWKLLKPSASQSDARKKAAGEGALFWQHVGRGRWKCMRKVTINGKRTTQHVGYVAHKGDLPH